MQRNLLIVGALVVALGLGAVGAYLAFLQNGDEIALAQLDRVVASYNGEYENATYDPASDRLVVEGLVLRNVLTDPEAEPLDLVEVHQLDVTGLTRFDLREVLSGGRTQNVFGRLEATGIVLTEEGQVISIDRFLAEDVTLSYDGAFDEGGEGDLTRPQEAARLALLLNAGAVHITGFQSPAEGPTGIQLGELALTDVESGTIGGITARDIALWDEGQMGTVGDTVRLEAGSFGLEGLDARVPLERLAQGEQVSFDRQSNVPIYETLTAENIVMREERGAPLEIGQVRVANAAYVGPMPTQTDMSITGLHLPLAGEFVDPQESAVLREFGYEELIFGFVYSAGYDFETQSFDLTDLTIRVDDMGEFHMSLEVGDVPFTEDMIDRNAEALLEDEFIAALLERAAMSHGEMSFTDAGLFDRVVVRNAEKAGQTREEYIQATVEGLRAQREQVASSDVAVQTIDALIAFTQTPGTITMTMAPDDPVPMQQMVLATQINPLILVELLNLQVAAGD